MSGEAIPMQEMNSGKGSSETTSNSDDEPIDLENPDTTVKATTDKNQSGVRMLLVDDDEEASSSSSSSTSDEFGLEDQAEHVEFAEDAMPICLEFRNIKYGIKVKKEGNLISKIRARQNPFRKERRELLHEMSGHFLPGRLVAIMGPSGAGKSTMLNFLSGRLKNGSKSGEVFVNGQRCKDKHYRRLSAYVMQDDALLGNLTPREMLRYAARLRLPRTSTRKQINARVEEVIAQLGLTKCANTRVGVPGVQRGVSGGERRRTSIALEMLTNPMVLFLDEPTSGLDSQAAESVVEMLKQLAQRGRTVICTIHQPSSEIFQMFDDVFWLSGGNLTYSGPVKQLPTYFKRAGHPCPKFSNPADFIMRLMAKTEDVTEEQFDERLQKLIEFRKTNNNVIPIEAKEKSRNIDLSVLPKVIKDTPHFYSQFWILLQRAFKQYVRDPGSTHQRLIQNIFVSVFTGLLFLQMDDNQKGIRDRLGVLYLTLIYSSFATGNAVLYIFPMERPTFLREYANGMYSVGAYYFAKSLADLPFNLIYPIIFDTIIYWMAGLRADTEAYFVNVITVVLISNVAQSLGLLVSVGLDLRAAMALFPVCVIPFLLVGGLFLSIDNIPVYFYWLQYTSFFFYAFTSVLLEEFGGGSTFGCSGDELQGGVCPLTTGDQVIESFGFDDYEVWIGIVGLIGLYIIMRVLTFLGLLILARKKSAT